MSAIFVALLAASPLVAAKQGIFQRQLASDTPSLPTCLFPPTTLVASPTGAPQLPSDVASYLDASVSDACGLNTAPATITSELLSYTSAYSSWVSVNLGALQSYASSVESYQSSVATQTACSSLYASSEDSDIITGSTLVASDFFPSEVLICSTGGVFGSAPSSGVVSTAPASNSAASTIVTASTGSAATSGSAASSASTTGRASSVSGSGTAASAASSSTSSAATPGLRAASAPAYLAYIGATFAVSAFIGMIAL